MVTWWCWSICGLLLIQWSLGLVTYKYELAQYEYHLRNLVQSHIPSGSQNETFMFQQWSMHTIKNLPKYYQYANYWNYETIRLFGELWHRKQRLGDLVPQRDCDYDLTSVEARSLEETSSELEILFRLQQWNCSSGTWIRGGASVDAHSLFAVYATPRTVDKEELGLTYTSSSRCFVEDLYSNEYVIHCRFHPNKHLGAHMRRSPHTLCVNTTFLVDFEHFDAFSELKPPMNTLNYFVPRNRSLAARTESFADLGYTIHVDTNHDSRTSGTVVCLERGAGIRIDPRQHHQSESTANADVHATSYWASHNNGGNHSLVVTASVRHPLAAAVGDGKFSQPGSHNTFGFANFRLDVDAISNDLQPTYAATAYLPFDQIKTCSQLSTMTLIGESHMRYYWDYLTREYFVDVAPFNTSTLERHHNAEYRVKEIIFEFQIFIEAASAEMISANIFLEAQMGKPVKTIVVQTGSWDIAYWPPRNYIENPTHGIQAFIQALEHIYHLREMALHDPPLQPTEPLSKSDALLTSYLSVLHIVVLDTSVQLRDVGSTDTDSWRNNYVTPAINQKLFEAIIAFVKEKKQKQQPRRSRRRLQAAARGHNNFVHLHHHNNGNSSSSTLHDDYEFNYDNLRQSYTLPEVAMKITLLNTMSMFHSKGWSTGAVCADHALCHNEGLEYQGIPQGFVALNMVTQAMCDLPTMHELLDLSEATKHITPAAITKNNEIRSQLEAKTALWESWAYNDFDIVRAEGSIQATDHYLVVGAFRRRFRDQYTLDVVHQRLCERQCQYSASLITCDCKRQKNFLVRELPEAVVANITQSNDLYSVIDGKQYFCPLTNSAVFADNQQFRYCSTTACPMNSWIQADLKVLDRFCPQQELIDRVISIGPLLSNCTMCNNVMGK